jgi:hypothetical protein
MSDVWVTTGLRDEADALARDISAMLQPLISGLDHRIALPPDSAAALAELEEALPLTQCPRWRQHQRAQKFPLCDWWLHTGRVGCRPAGNRL